MLSPVATSSSFASLSRSGKACSHVAGHKLWRRCPTRFSITCVPCSNRKPASLLRHPDLIRALAVLTRTVRENLIALAKPGRITLIR